MPQIEFDHVSKYFMNEKRRFAAIDELSLSIEAGDFVFLIGSSGAGKTTLLRLLANHITPEEGAIWVEGQQINRIPQWRRPLYRRRIGQVWQEPALIRKKTIGENLEIVQRAMGGSNRVIPQMADSYPYMLSGGQIKLVELARAIICNPHILLLDEITANLDDDTGWDIMNILNEINRRGTTIIMATHAKNFVNIMCRRVVTLVSGRIAGDVEKGKYGELR